MLKIQNIINIQLLTNFFFLSRSMYISGVPGTGKTATVKRVIDSLNSDIIMKHSFKVILL